VYAYLSDSIPECCLNQIDKNLIASFHKRCPGFRKRFLGSLPRKQREEAITRFILALSDQQLVTGMAILFATVKNQCTFSYQEFGIAMSVGWFSATTHLATLDCLRGYFLAHPTVRNWRVLGMMIVLGLLIYCLSIWSLIPNFEDVRIPMECALQEIGPDPISKIYYGWYWWGVMVCLLKIYIDEVLESYSTSRAHHRSYIKRIISKCLYLYFLARYRLRVQPELRTTVFDELAADASAKAHRHLLENPPSIPYQLSNLMSIQYSYSGSFLSVFPALNLMLSYGICQFIAVRWLSSYYANVDTSWGIGQLTPILFLLIPLLAGAELY
jgi:hypothetical protein